MIQNQSYFYFISCYILFHVLFCKLEPSPNYDWLCNLCHSCFNLFITSNFMNLHKWKEYFWVTILSNIMKRFECHYFFNVVLWKYYFIRQYCHVKCFIHLTRWSALIQNIKMHYGFLKQKQSKFERNVLRYMSCRFIGNIAVML